MLLLPPAPCACTYVPGEPPQGRVCFEAYEGLSFAHLKNESWSFISFCLGVVFILEVRDPYLRPYRAALGFGNQSFKPVLFCCFFSEENNLLTYIQILVI